MTFFYWVTLECLNEKQLFSLKSIRQYQVSNILNVANVKVSLVCGFHFISLSPTASSTILFSVDNFSSAWNRFTNRIPHLFENNWNFTPSEDENCWKTKKYKDTKSILKANFIENLKKKHEKSNNRIVVVIKGERKHTIQYKHSHSHYRRLLTVPMGISINAKITNEIVEKMFEYGSKT